MKFQKVNIATAKIVGLTSSPYYCEHNCLFTWNIMFENSSTTLFRNISYVMMGKTKEEAEFFCNQIENKIKEAHINEGDKVAVIFEEDGDVLAIGTIGQDMWIDVNDKFKKKTFKELNIVITSLTVY